MLTFSSSKASLYSNLVNISYANNHRKNFQFWTLWKSHLSSIVVLLNLGQTSITWSDNLKKMSVIYVSFYNSVSRLHYKVIAKSIYVKRWILQHWGLISETITPLSEKECVTWEDQIFAQNVWKTQSCPQRKGRKLEIQKSPTGDSHWLNTSFACFPHVPSLSVMKESVRCSALFTKQSR